MGILPLNLKRNFSMTNPLGYDMIALGSFLFVKHMGIKNDETTHRQPGLNAKENDTVYLAFPPVKDALLYKGGIRTAYDGKDKAMPKGIRPVSIAGVPVLVPDGSEAILRCEIAGSYKNPFKKVRICNCNLEDAQGKTDDIILEDTKARET